MYARLKSTLKDFESEITNTAQMSENFIVIKDNRIYNHKLARFYYTTYDVRREEDVINPRTSHCNIMLLADLKLENKSSLDASNDSHPFIYGRVIGIYHVNVIYIGPGKQGYESMRFDFLHVRWLQLDTIKTQGWASLRLDQLSFPPVASKNAFGFVDPSLVLRSCHLIPGFCSEKSHPDGIGLSTISDDKNDWKKYYVNRCVRFYTFTFYSFN